MKFPLTTYGSSSILDTMYDGCTGYIHDLKWKDSADYPIKIWIALGEYVGAL